MKIVTPSYYKDFKCIAGACPDSCCQGWEVDVDDETLCSYQGVTHPIKQKIDSLLDKDEFDNTIFRLADKKRCPFLNQQNLCDMHIAIGQQYTPFTCRNFPRFTNCFGATKEIGISFSCPVASDMIWNLEKSLEFEQEFTDELPVLNDIDAQLYITLVSARKKCFDILQNQNDSLKDRLLSVLNYANHLQQQIKPYNEGGDTIDFFDVFKNPEVINQQWVDKVNNYAYAPIQNTISNENVATYFIYKYFLDAVFDKDVLSKVKMAVIGVLITTYFGNDSWTIHLWSKETEHSQYNMDRYKDLLKSADCLSVSELKKRIELL